MFKKIPGHSDIPQGLGTIQAVGPQNRPTLSVLEGTRSGVSEEGSQGWNREGLERSSKGREAGQCTVCAGTMSSASCLGGGSPVGR